MKTCYINALCTKCETITPVSVQCNNEPRHSFKKKCANSECNETVTGEISCDRSQDITEEAVAESSNARISQHIDDEDDCMTVASTSTTASTRKRRTPDTFTTVTNKRNKAMSSRRSKQTSRDPSPTPAASQQQSPPQQSK